MENEIGYVYYTHITEPGICRRIPTSFLSKNNLNKKEIKCSEDTIYLNVIDDNSIDSISIPHTIRRVSCHFNRLKELKYYKGSNEIDHESLASFLRCHNNLIKTLDVITNIEHIISDNVKLTSTSKIPNLKLEFKC